MRSFSGNLNHRRQDVRELRYTVNRLTTSSTTLFHERISGGSSSLLLLVIDF
ncbi:hypothetical protein SOVF_060110 [Spinacia oleracea]|nr:hypothetical protein SOVF_060110 [Spinacia oleracea]